MSKNFNENLSNYESKYTRARKTDISGLLANLQAVGAGIRDEIDYDAAKRKSKRGLMGTQSAKKISPEPTEDQYMFSGMMQGFKNDAEKIKEEIKVASVNKEEAFKFSINSKTEDLGQRLMQDVQEALGLNKMQAAAIVGNFAHETGNFKYVDEIDGPGKNVAQYTDMASNISQEERNKLNVEDALKKGLRKTAFKTYATKNNLDPNSFDTGFKFFIYEIQNTNEGRVIEKLESAKTLEEATRIFSKGYLRPGKPKMDSRISYANSYFNMSGE